MKIKENAWYQRGDGTVGEAKPNPGVENQDYPWLIAGGAFTDDGKWLRDKDSPGRDIIKEVIVTPVEPTPQPKADPSYNVQLDGTPVPPPPDGYEVVPEGEEIGELSLIFAEDWRGSAAPGNMKAHHTPFARAYARKKKPEARIGQPGEVWMSWLGIPFVLYESYSIPLGNPEGKMVDFKCPASRWKDGDGSHNAFLAPDLETWARQKWGLGEDEREKLDAEIQELRSVRHNAIMERYELSDERRELLGRIEGLETTRDNLRRDAERMKEEWKDEVAYITDEKEGLESQVRDQQKHIAKLMNRLQTAREGLAIYQRDYVRKADSLESHKEK